MKDVTWDQLRGDDNRGKGEIGNKEVLGPSGSTSLASTRRNNLGDNVVPSPATNLLKADDSAVLPGPCTSPRSIDHASEHSWISIDVKAVHKLLCLQRVPYGLQWAILQVFIS